MDLTFSSAAELLSALKSGALTAEALMTATLRRIEAENPRVNAIVALRDRDDLIAEARRMDRSGEPRGALHGLPIAVKDLVNVRGIRSTHGSPIYADLIPQADDLIAARLRAAGAILIGKTNVPEFGLGSHTFNPVYGATRNPYDGSVTCGGSSGGAAVALATGMTALADGSDMMGSLRNPAAWNNVYGLRPTWGRVPSEPAGDLYLHQLSTLGPMARSPADIALLLDVIGGPDRRRPESQPPENTAPVQPRDPRGLRVGWICDWGNMPMDAGLQDVNEAGLKVLQDLGAHVDIVTPEFSADQIWQSWIDLRSFSVAMGLRTLSDQRDKLKDSAIWELDRGLQMQASDIQSASESRSDWFRAAVDLFDRFDVLVMPSTQVWPFPVDVSYPTEIAGQQMDTYHRWMQVVTPVSLIGLPSLAVPTGFGPTGLPAGVQIFGRPGSDKMLLEIGEAYHQATRWPQNAPPHVGSAGQTN